MKKHHLLLIAAVLGCTLSETAYAQYGNCGNMDFEDGTINGWTGNFGKTPYKGTCCTSPYVAVPINSGINNKTARITIMQGGADPYAGFSLTPPPLPGNANTNNYCVRLGHDYTTYNFMDGGYKRQTLNYDFTPDQNNYMLIVQYAVVLNEPAGAVGHNGELAPHFKMEAYDDQGNLINCLYEFQTANDPNSTKNGYKTQGVVTYKTWTNKIMDFSNYMNKTIKITRK